MHSGWSRVVCGVLLLISSGCTSVPEPVVKQPATIAVRNLSHEFLQSVHLSAAVVRVDAPARFGAVSPVPEGVTQSVTRARNAPPLPPEMLIRWVDRLGQQYEARINIQELLARSTGSAAEVLVFIIQPNHSVRAVLEYTN